MIKCKSATNIPSESRMTEAAVEGRAESVVWLQGTTALDVVRSEWLDIVWFERVTALDAVGCEGATAHDVVWSEGLEIVWLERVIALDVV